MIPLLVKLVYPRNKYCFYLFSTCYKIIFYKKYVSLLRNMKIKKSDIQLIFAIFISHYHVTMYKWKITKQVGYH